MEDLNKMYKNVFQQNCNFQAASETAAALGEQLSNKQVTGRFE
jgi:hypothetical protein